MKFLSTVFSFALLLPTLALAAPTATALMKGPEGEDMGQVRFTEGPNGLLAQIEVKNLPSSTWHAIHVHQMGSCKAESFESAGEHAAPAAHKHGFMTKEGMHAGDMPNIWADANGVTMAQFFLVDIQLEELLDKDGAAVIVHRDPDDYRSQPSGNAGDRLGCGVIEFTQK